MNELEEKLKKLTAEFMNTCPKQSHKRTRQIIEMQMLKREIKANTHLTKKYSHKS